MRSSIQVMREYDKLYNLLPDELALHVANEIEKGLGEYKDLADMCEQVAQYRVPEEPEKLYAWAATHDDECNEYLNEEFEVLTELSIRGIIADAWFYTNRNALLRQMHVIEQMTALWRFHVNEVNEISEEKWRLVKHAVYMKGEEWNAMDWYDGLRELVLAEV